jgi:hypothetical protein
MYNAKKTLKKIKNHVDDNKVAYAMGAVAIAAIALQQANRVAFYKFLASKGIDPEEYYCPEAYEEKNEK